MKAGRITKGRIMKTVLSVVIAAIGGTLFLAGCASTNTSDEKSLLSAAGFRTATPQTAEQHQAFAALPAYKFERAVADDKVFYVYRDEKQGLAYVGGEAEYQRYQQLARQKHSENYQAAQLNSQAATRWYGAWGPGTPWW